MRLHIHHQVGSVDGLCRFHFEVEEPITVTQQTVADARLIDLDIDTERKAA